MLEIGKKYTDGWGSIHEVGGVTKANPDWVWTIQGNWYRQSDGRRIAYLLVDPTKPDGERRHVASKNPSNWDLRIVKI